MKNKSSVNAEKPDLPALGISLRVLSSALLAAMVILVKTVFDDVQVGQIVFFRSAFALTPPLFAFLWRKGEFPGGLATVWRAGAVILGTIGVVALVWPELDQTATNDTRLIGFGFGILMGLLTALALIMVRSLSRTESPGAIAFHFVLASMAGTALVLPLGWTTPSLNELLQRVGASIFGGFAHICMTLSGTRKRRVLLRSSTWILWPIWPISRCLVSPSRHRFPWRLALVLSGAALAALESRKRP
ncbi:EamA/RhaT family transporter [Agrobacterium vitis]|uniref:EamA/RhaT family transporter n=1 Tax=Agrobacterium vitis TaxID=373 RepID=UPI0018D45B4E|nr:EamA/RhaT family transporter [Agrobacterium vitis]